MQQFVCTARAVHSGVSGSSHSWYTRVQYTYFSSCQLRIYFCTALMKEACIWYGNIFGTKQVFISTHICMYVTPVHEVNPHSKCSTAVYTGAWYAFAKQCILLNVCMHQFCIYVMMKPCVPSTPPPYHYVICTILDISCLVQDELLLV